jgi:hypothetical protein
MIKGIQVGVLATFLSFGSHAATLIHEYIFQGNVNDQVGSADGTLQNGATASGGVLSLIAASGQYVQFGTHIVPTSGSYSVVLTEQHNSSQPGSYTEMISQGSSGGPGFYIGQDPSGNFRVGDTWISTGIPFPTAAGYHQIALTVDSVGGTSKLYIDGGLAGSFGFAIGSTSGGADTQFGHQFTGTEPFDGNLKDVRIYTGALTDEEITGLATAPEPGMLGVIGAALAAVGLVRRKRQ